MDARRGNRQPADRQRIACLTPLEAALRCIEASVLPVAPRQAPLDDLLGATLAADAILDTLQPVGPTALIDGFAVRAEWTADASGYAPAPLLQAVEIDSGEVLPDGFDAVLPSDAVTWLAGSPEAVAEAARGDGVMTPGTDGVRGEVLRRSGERLRATDLAAMTALGIASAHIRHPRIRLAVAREGRGGSTQATFDWLRHAIAADGGIPEFLPINASALATLFAKPEADAIILVGGAGVSAGDRAVQELAQAGNVEFHGVAISPGERAAFGVASVPVLVVPHRIDGALGAWLLIGRAMLARLRGAVEARRSTPWDTSSVDRWSCDDEAERKMPLTTKIVSTVGLTEVMLVSRKPDGAVASLGAKYFPLASLAHADGYIIVPAANEGFASGTRVCVRSLP